MIKYFEDYLLGKSDRTLEEIQADFSKCKKEVLDSLDALKDLDVSIQPEVEEMLRTCELDTCQNQTDLDSMNASFDSWFDESIKKYRKQRK